MKKLLAVCLLLISIHSVAVVLPAPAAPSVNAKAYILAETLTGTILSDKNSAQRVEPASLTKIMTVYVAAHELREGGISLQDQVIVSQKAWKMGGSKMFLEVKDQVSVDQLLMGIIVQSGNDASVALAEHISGTEEVFTVLMNLRAEELGMSGTHFENATGWPSPDHYTTVEDLYKLTLAMINEFPEVYSRYSTKEYSYGDISQQNRNKLLWRDESVDGVKTGHTESAGYCLISSAKRKGTRLISVVVGSTSKDSRIDASQSLLNYGFRFFETHTLKKGHQNLTDTRVWLGAKDSVSLGIEKDLNVVIPRRQYEHLKATMDIDSRLIAPIKAGDSYGSLSVSLNEKEISRVPLIALETIEEGSFVKQMMDKVKLWLE